MGYWVCTTVITVALIVIGCYYSSIQETILLPHEYSDLERVAVNADWITMLLHDLIGDVFTSVSIVCNYKLTVALINPIAMEEGLRFAIREGGKTVGSGRVAL